MYLAINYSLPAAQLVQEAKIEVDYFKTPNWEWLIHQAEILRPVAVHFSLEAGNAGLDRVDWEAIENLARVTQTPYINLHLDATQEHFPDLQVNSTLPSDVKKVLSILLSDVKVAVNHFGADRIIVENSPYHGLPGKTMRSCIEPEIINQVVEESGCGFLLDISHALITAHTLGMDYEKYFAKLPLQKIKEMHFTGIHRMNGLLTDHLSILAKDWNRFDWVLSHICVGDWSKPWLLAFEYGGVGSQFEWRSNRRVIEEQVPKLLEKIKTIPF